MYNRNGDWSTQLDKIKNLHSEVHSGVVNNPCICRVIGKPAKDSGGAVDGRSLTKRGRCDSISLRLLCSIRTAISVSAYGLPPDPVPTRETGWCLLQAMRPNQKP